ncbi:MAG: class I SAM-dependent methyltransferase [Deltaproteobacteria bacterium]|nr:class I SAM-dependent methyltransferase [Deltaproteobacteria bacterium]
MDTAVIRAINRLWLEVYPGLARQAADLCPQPPRRILEVGCFSGGTGLELLRLFPHSRLAVAQEISELAETFFADWPIDAAAGSRIDIRPTPLVPLALPDAAFDLVVCRGVFFFLDEKAGLLAEMHRVLAPGGVCFAGGGFGSHTPRAVIDPIADESRRLNYELGKKVVSPEEFRAMLDRNGIRADLVHDGGLWALMKK